MSNAAARKKSIVSSTGLQIDTPVANNTLLNQAAITSLYQESVRLRTKLLQIRGFKYYYDLVEAADARQSTDPVTQLWDLFSLGISLCYVFDQLVGPQKINNSEFNKETYEANPDKAKKHAIALFAMQVRQQQVAIPGAEPFTVTDLWDRNSTDGLVKVIKTVSAIVAHLPEDAFDDAAPSPPYLSSHDSHDSLATPSPAAPPATGQEAARNNITREMVETERKYVQDLEIMQQYAAALAQSKSVDQDTIHFLFPNLKLLLNFQRKFLIKLESTAVQPWSEQRWGLHFMESEEEFAVYEPYCANYTYASDLMMTLESALSIHNHLINVKGELPAFLIKPIQRVCKYPLLLDSLIKAANADTYPYYDELKAGSEAAKRITDKINEAQRHAENALVVKNLQSRVEDWKGHHLENFGQLLLDDRFVVTKSDIDREYHVFLFEKIILCCKEAPPQSANAKKMSKSNSLLKKQSTLSPLPPPNPNQKNNNSTPLLLKGRIFLGNVTQAKPQSPRNSVPAGAQLSYPLAVYWKGDDDLEHFTLRCKREDQMRQWETVINRLIKEIAARRQSERPVARMASGSNASMRNYPAYPPNTPTHNGQHTPRSRTESVYDQNGYLNAYNSGPNGYPTHDGFEADEDDYEDYPYNPTSSGRGTPVNGRRGTAASLPPEREPQPAPYDRSRAQTETTENLQQWRGVAATQQPSRPAPTRLASTMSNMSTSSFASDGSFGPGVRQRPALKSQFSSSRMKDMYQNGAPPSQKSSPTMPAQTPAIINRARSASQPNAYVPKNTMPPPPLPSGAWNYSQSSGSLSSMTQKRGSSSSQSTNSSDYSPNSSSPITPYGSSESSLGGPLRASRSQMFDAVNGPGHAPFPHPVKVKVHFHEDIFVIQVPRATEYDDLVEKVGRKIRLCGPRRDDGPLRVKYRDEDGDMVSLGSTEDVQMAFEQYRPGGQVTLYVH